MRFIQRLPAFLCPLYRESLNNMDMGIVSRRIVRIAAPVDRGNRAQAAGYKVPIYKIANDLDLFPGRQFIRKGPNKLPGCTGILTYF